MRGSRSRDGSEPLKDEGEDEERAGACQAPALLSLGNALVVGQHHPNYAPDAPRVWDVDLFRARPVGRSLPPGEAHGASPTLAQLSRREKPQAKKALPAAGSPKAGGGASAGLVYEDRPSAESAAIRNAAAMKARLCFGMTAFFLKRWIFAVSVSLSSATLI